jgi:hypothetical protein
MEDESRPGPFSGLEDIGPLDEDTKLGSLGRDTISDKIFDDIDLSQPPTTGVGMVEPAPSQEMNQETCDCLRGPCCHVFHIIQRMEAQSEIFMIQRSTYCTFHYELLNLAEENIYACGQWWPEFLRWVPKSLRPFFRPALRELWDAYLKLRGADFSWRWWPRNVWDLTPENLHELRQAAIRRKDALDAEGTNGG